MKLDTFITDTYIVEEVAITPGEERIVLVKARKQGIFAWLGARIFKSFEGVKFDVHSDRMVYTAKLTHIIPMKQVSNFIVGRFINPLWIILAIASLLLGFIQFANNGAGVGFLMLLLAALFVFLFITSSRMMISVIASSGEGFSLCLKSSSMGGPKFGEEEAAKIADAVIKQISAM